MSLKTHHVAVDRTWAIEWQIVKPEEWENKRLACLALLELYEDKLAINKESWHIAANNLGSAYALAYGTHVKAVEEAAREQALSEALAYGVLTAVSAGLLGWVGEAAQAGKLGQRLMTIMAAGLEDAVQSGIGESIDVRQAQVTPIPVTGSQIPSVFQNDLENIVRDQWAEVLTYFVDIKTLLKNKEPADFELCCQSAKVGQIGTREDYCYEELRVSSLRVLL